MDASVSDEDHALNLMVSMYDDVCTAVRSPKGTSNIISVYALYDCVSLILAYMLKRFLRIKSKSHNANRLHAATTAIHEDSLNQMFIDFDIDYFGKQYLTLAMDAVQYDTCRQDLFWRKVKQYLERKSPETHSPVSSFY
jgi:hypothetical protein